MRGAIRNILSCMIIVVTPGLLSAQGAFCGEYDYLICQSVGGHIVSGPYGGTVDGTHGGDCRDDFHWSCAPMEDDQAAAQAANDAYEFAVSAFQDGSLDEVLAVAETYADVVVYNRSRRAFQLMDCRGDRIIASINLPEEYVSLAEALVEQ